MTIIPGIEIDGKLLEQFVELTNDEMRQHVTAMFRDDYMEGFVVTDLIETLERGTDKWIIRLSTHPVNNGGTVKYNDVYDNTFRSWLCKRVSKDGLFFIQHIKRLENGSWLLKMQRSVFSHLDGN